MKIFKILWWTKFSPRFLSFTCALIAKNYILNLTIKLRKNFFFHSLLPTFLTNFCLSSLHNSSKILLSEGVCSRRARPHPPVCHSNTWSGALPETPWGTREFRTVTFAPLVFHRSFAHHNVNNILSAWWSVNLVNCHCTPATLKVRSLIHQLVFGFS